MCVHRGALIAGNGERIAEVVEHTGVQRRLPVLARDDRRIESSERLARLLICDEQIAELLLIVGRQRAVCRLLQCGLPGPQRLQSLLVQTHLLTRGRDAQSRTHLEASVEIVVGQQRTPVRHSLLERTAAEVQTRAIEDLCVAIGGVRRDGQQSRQQDCAAGDGCHAHLSPADLRAEVNAIVLKHVPARAHGPLDQ
jgi:hypothetical protein